jgi:dienelactone hydrolase
MTSSLRWVGILPGGLLLLGILLVVVLLQGWHIKKYEPHQLAGLLQSSFRIQFPTRPGPYPTVIGFHGCGGLDLGAIEWMEHLVGRGYATVLVDSYAFRDLTPARVCTGRTFWGSERAGDVVAAIYAVRRLPLVDRDRLILLGWSHGAWAIMDALALDPPHSLPTNLRSSPPEPLAGVSGIVLFYPYCGLLAEAHGHGWSSDIPVLMLLAGQDSVVSPSDCVDIVAVLQADGRPITSHLYENADHAFDMSEEDLATSHLVRRPQLIADAQKRLEQFFSAVLSEQ